MAERSRMKDAGRRTDLGPDAGEKMERPVAEDPTRAKPEPADAVPGQLAVDDRGNISWEWTDDPELQADDLLGNTARLRALAPKHLKLSDEEPEAVARSPVPVRKTPQSGYNPYESGEPTKSSWKKKRDLRQLSEWIALKKRMGRKSGED
jgi:hypothetical protein